MKALVHSTAGTVADIVADDATFEVHESFLWKDMIADYDSATDTPAEYNYDAETDTISRIVYETPSYDVQRQMAYDSIQQQLDSLWHDVDDGKFGDNAKTGGWYNALRSTKTAYPKP